ncbi:MAG: PilZ domain-containing protein, partial [Myxococcota bacterium]|nr:PilZ domain-containing protein [Myxococcota bacterium]
MEAFDFDDQESAKRHNHRRAPRIEKRLEIVLQFPEREQRYITRDISYVGVFVETPEPLPLRKLMRVQVKLDEEQEPVKMLGLVAHRVNSADAMETGKPTGMGIQLF